MSRAIPIMLTILFSLALYGFVSATVDLRFDNKDMMLCNSALQSGNEEYLRKCECYYAGENIRCIYNE